MNGSLLTRLRFRTALWCHARLMPFRAISTRSLSSLRAFADCSPTGTYAGLAPEYVLRHVAQVTRHPYLMRKRRCLRQGLLAFRFMRGAGYDVELHFGIDRLHPHEMRAHCWLVHKGQIVLNPPDARTQTIFVHPRRDRGAKACAADRLND